MNEGYFELTRNAAYLLQILPPTLILQDSPILYKSPQVIKLGLCHFQGMQKIGQYGLALLTRAKDYTLYNAFIYLQ